MSTDVREFVFPPASDGSTSDSEDEDQLYPPPPIVIVANVPSAVFSEETEKDKFEQLFFQHSCHPRFYYFKSFHRVRVEFLSATAAEKARLALDNTEVDGQVIRVFEGKVHHIGAQYLKPPKVEKMFLISPPCSPPVGWEQVVESDPVVDYTLQAAIACLTGAGESYELHPATESQPSIVVVNPTDEPELRIDSDLGAGGWISSKRLSSIPQTSRPPL